MTCLRACQNTSALQHYFPVHCTRAPFNHSIYSSQWCYWAGKIASASMEVVTWIVIVVVVAVKLFRRKLCDECSHLLPTLGGSFKLCHFRIVSSSSNLGFLCPQPRPLSTVDLHFIRSGQLLLGMCISRHSTCNLACR